TGATAVVPEPEKDTGGGMDAAQAKMISALMRNSRASEETANEEEMGVAHVCLFEPSSPKAQEQWW
ncbi:hypothetical protein SARC_15079, partial [Sphaeroforma arctica JP610]